MGMTATWIFAPGDASGAVPDGWDGWDVLADVREGWVGAMSMELSVPAVLPAGMPRQDGPTMLVAHVEDSGYCVLTAGGETLPHWRWVLNDQPFTAEYPPTVVAASGQEERRRQVVPAIVQWATACGLPQPDPARLNEVLAQEHIPAESGMYALLRVLGIVLPGTRPLPHEAPATPPTSAVPRTVDGVVNAFAAPALKAAGFVRNKRHFRKTNDNGDLLALGFQVGRVPDGVAFVVEFGLIPAAFRDWRSHTTPAHAGDDYVSGLLRYRIPAPADVTPPSEHGPEDQWEFSHHALQRGAGAALTRVLTQEAIPWMNRLLEPGVLVDMRANPAETRFGRSTRDPYDLLFWLVDEEPSDAFDEVWSRLSGWDHFESGLREWAAQRAARRVRERRPAGPVEQLVADRVTPFLAARGFTWLDGAFRKSNAAGDQAIIEIARAHSSTDEDVAFRVDRAVVPKMHWEWLRSAERGMAASVPLVPDGWCQKRVAPPIEHEFVRGAGDGLELRLWRVEGCADALEAALEEELPRLAALLDREHLLAVVTDQDGSREERHRIPAHGHAELVLLLDQGPSAELDAAFEWIAADDFLASNNDELVTWAKTQLGRA